MKRTCLSLLLWGIIFSFPIYAQNQNVSEYNSELPLLHQPKQILLSGGVTMYGSSVRVGYFPKKHWWIGTEGELHFLFSTRREAGIFTRYYTGSLKSVNAFIGTGISYGHFKMLNFNIDDPRPDEEYSSPKINALVGLELRLSRTISLEGVIKAGKLTQVNWTLPSLQLSANIYLGRTLKKTQ